MIRCSRLMAVSLLTIALAVASGCSSGNSDGGDQGSSATELDKVSYITAFGAVGRDSFAWLAKEKGFFKEVGIDVQVVEGAGNEKNLTALKSGEVQFAALDLTGAVIQAGQGKFTDWRAIAAIHQQTLVSVMTTKDTGITRPKDLEGRKMAIGAGSVTQILFPTYAKLAGVDEAQVDIQGVQTTTLNGLMAQRKVDALGTFLLSKNALAKAAGKEVVILPYSDYLSDLFGNVIITTPALIRDNPDLVKRFVNAALKGLKYTIENPKEAATILNKVKPTYSVDAGVGEIEAMKPYVNPAGGASIGWIDEQRVAKSIAILQGAGAIPAGLKPADVFDGSFVPKS